MIYKLNLVTISLNYMQSVILNFILNFLIYLLLLLNKFRLYAITIKAKLQFTQNVPIIIVKYPN